MTKLKKLTSWISLLLYITIFNCTTLYHTSIKFNPETDCTDQNFNEFDFNAFQISQKNPSRSIEAIYPKIASIEKPLIELFKDNHDNLLNLPKYILTFQALSLKMLTEPMNLQCIAADKVQLSNHIPLKTSSILFY